MNLREYFKSTGMKIVHFCKGTKLSRTCVDNLIKGDTDPRLSIAVTVEQFTGGMVSCVDLLPNWFCRPNSPLRRLPVRGNKAKPDEKRKDKHTQKKYENP